jgi:hypothetical protein
MPVRLSADRFAFPPEICMPTFLPYGRPANLVTRRPACLSTGRSACQSAHRSACLVGRPACICVLLAYLTYKLVDLPAALLVRACLPAGIEAYFSACLGTSFPACLQ